VKGKSPVEIRVELARGHFLVGEPAQAIASLEAAVREDPRHPGLRALIEELMTDPSTYTVRASLDGVRARLGASVAPVAVEPVVRPRPALVEVGAAEEELEVEPLAESAAMFAKPAAVPAKPAPARPAAEKMAAAKATPLAPPVAAAKPALAAAAQPAAATAKPAVATGRARTLAELERWLRNVPRIKRTEVRA